jgi:hypothetical protein
MFYTMTKYNLDWFLKTVENNLQKLRKSVKD